VECDTSVCPYQVRLYTSSFYTTVRAAGKAHALATKNDKKGAKARGADAVKRIANPVQNGQESEGTDKRKKKRKMKSLNRSRKGNNRGNHPSVQSRVPRQGNPKMGNVHRRLGRKPRRRVPACPRPAVSVRRYAVTTNGHRHICTCTWLYSRAYTHTSARVSGTDETPTGQWSETVSKRRLSGVELSFLFRLLLQAPHESRWRCFQRSLEVRLHR
jgi:hypothetical protein